MLRTVNWLRLATLLRPSTTRLCQFKESASTRSFRYLSTATSSGDANSKNGKKSISFPLADIGEGMSEAKIATWYVKVGDKVSQFDPICQVESDKATVDITSRYDGVVKKIHFAANDSARVGAPLLDIEVDEAVPAAASEIHKPSAEPKITSDEILKEPFDSAASKGQQNQGDSNPQNPAGSLLRDLKTDSSAGSKILAVPSVRSLASRLGLDVAMIKGTGPDGRILREDVERFKSGLQSATPSSSSRTQIEESGRDRGRHESQSSPVRADIVSTLSQPRDSAILGQAQEVQLTQVQKAMFKTMTRSLEIPTFVYCDEADVQNLESIRRQHQQSISKLGRSLKPNSSSTTKRGAGPPASGGTGADNQNAQNSLSVMPKPSTLCYIIKTMSLALRAYPQLNAHLINPKILPLNAGSSVSQSAAAPPTVSGPDSSADQQPRLLVHSSHNIGVAIDSPSGLVVPCLRNVERLSIVEISEELGRLRKAATEGRLRPTDYKGATITLSNIGAIGGSYMSPIVTPPQVCIVALGRADWRKTYTEAKGGDNGGPSQQQPSGRLIKAYSKMMPISLSADHRVIDGATAANFVQLWKEYMKNPISVFTELS